MKKRLFLQCSRLCGENPWNSICRRPIAARIKKEPNSVWMRMQVASYCGINTVVSQHMIFKHHGFLQWDLVRLCEGACEKQGNWFTILNYAKGDITYERREGSIEAIVFGKFQRQ